MGGVVFFEMHFFKVKFLIQEQIKYDDIPYSVNQNVIVDTVAFDGLDIKVNIRKKNLNRCNKGGKDTV